MPQNQRKSRIEQDDHERPLLWVEQPLGDWIAAYGFVGRDRELTLAEVRVFPAGDGDPERPIAEWSRDAALVPQGGLPTRDALRRLRPAEALGDAFLQMTERNASNRRLVQLKDLGDYVVDADRQARPRTKPRRDPKLLARVALLYEAALERNQPPNRVIYESFLNTENQIAPRSAAGLVKAARDAGFLSPPSRGRATGKATTAAHELLRELREGNAGD